MEHKEIMEKYSRASNSGDLNFTLNVAITSSVTLIMLTESNSLLLLV